MKQKLRLVLNLNTFFLGLVFIFAVGYCTLAFSLPWGSARMPGAGFMPRIIGIATACLSMGLLIQDGIKTILHGANKPEKLAHSWRLFWYVGSFIVYALIFRPVGYVLSTVAFTFVLCKVMDNSWFISALIAVLTGIAFYIIFSLLSVPLPMGVLAGLKLL